MKLDRFGCGLEVKFAPDSDGKVGKFSGYGAVFNNTDSGGDMIERGAFKQTLSEWSVKGKFPPMLLQHGGFMGNADDLLPIGQWTSMEENSKGLKIEGELFALNTERGQYIYEGMKAGALDGLSIGWVPSKSQYVFGSKPTEPRRTLKSIALAELSVVTFPMNDKALIGSVKAIEQLETISEFEDYLCETGLSRKQALVFISRLTKRLRPSDSEGQKGVDAARRAADRLLSIITPARG